MIREVLAKYPMGSLNGFGMLLFLTVFVAVVFQVLNKKNRQRYVEMAALPFDQGSNSFAVPFSGHSKEER